MVRVYHSGFPWSITGRRPFLPPSGDAGVELGPGLRQAEFVLEGETAARMLKARLACDGKPVTYTAAVTKLAPGVIHLVALAKIPGLMPDMSHNHLWAELTGPRYTTPLLRAWIPWLKTAMSDGGGIVVANGFAATVGVLKTEPDALDEIVSQGVRDRHLTLCGRR
jgi:hypothetical protein